VLLVVVTVAIRGSRMYDRSSTTTLDRAPRQHTLVMPATGSRVRLGVGDRLDVQMRQIVGSGSEWKVTGVPQGLVLEREDEFLRGRVGEGFTTRVFHFRAADEFCGALRLSVVRRDGSVLGNVDIDVSVD
jgi:hypothetical protein